MTEAYTRLEEKFKKISLVGDVSGMLHWDMATMMPDGGAQSRSEQLAFLATLRHEYVTSDELGDLLEEAVEQKNLTDWQQANVREMKRTHTHATALDADLVEALSRASMTCEQIWREARPEGDFKKVLPALRELLDLSRQKAAAKAEKLNCSPYDALLDQYEPDGRSAEIDPIFEELETFLPDFLEEVRSHQSKTTLLSPEGPFDIGAQEKLGTFLMQAVGFDFTHGRLDVSRHPFCGGTQQDVRMTTRYDENDFTSALMGVLHETGHALYEQGLPKAWNHQPVGNALGMSFHESQSLLIEMQVCRSHAFLSFALPHMQKAFNAEGPAWNLDNMVALYQKVEPGFIRVDADEVTYPAHVILRYKLERQLIEGTMDLADLPEAWNDMIYNMLGLRVENDRDGCLQDIHWFDGAWGYFPTYTLGAMTAAQIYQTAKTALPDLEAQIAQGKFHDLRAWLETHIHAKARLKSSRDLLIEVSAEPLNPAIFTNHLRTRYLA